uniref:Uncharacterized protein n=1 Tax=viral metagenome TaxID=1070528 RepID=A0A6C0C6Z5_9ZZZZ
MNINDWKNMYWDQVNKRKNEQQRYIPKYNIVNNNNDELLKRLTLLEQKNIYGEIYSIDKNFIVIKTDIGKISVHKSNYNGINFSYKHINKLCKFKLIYHINKYQGKDITFI